MTWHEKWYEWKDAGFWKLWASARNVKDHWRRYAMLCVTLKEKTCLVVLIQWPQTSKCRSSQTVSAVWLLVAHFTSHIHLHGLLVCYAAGLSSAKGLTLFKGFAHRTQETPYQWIIPSVHQDQYPLLRWAAALGVRLPTSRQHFGDQFPWRKCLLWRMYSKALNTADAPSLFQPTLDSFLAEKAEDTYL